MRGKIFCFAIASAQLLAWQPGAKAAVLRDLGGYAQLGSTLGVSGLAVGDVDGDGRAEILVTGSSQTFGGAGTFSVLRADPLAANGYREVAFSSVFEAGISAATLLDLTNDGSEEIIVGLADGTVHIYARLDLREIGSTTVPGAVKQFVLADADNDGREDLVVLGTDSITLLDPATLASRGSVPFGAAEVAIGNVDSDPAVETVLNTGSVLRLSNTGSDLLAEQIWTYPSGDFGQHIGLADVDADGKLELVAESNWDYLTVFDLDLEAPKWQINQLGDLDAMTLADVNGDHVPDALVGSGQWGDETAIDLTTRAILWSVPNPEHGTGHIVVADVDGDQEDDFLWTAGWSDTGQDVLHAYALPGLNEKFETLDVSGPFDAVAVSPDSSGLPRRVAFASWSSESGYGDGIVWQWDATTLEPLTATESNSFEGFAWTGIHALAYGNAYNEEGSLDLLVGTDRLYDGAIYVLDADTSTVEEQRLYDSGSPINALAVADLDDDGENEIIAGNTGATTGSPGTYVTIFDAASGFEEWRSISLSSTFGDIPSVSVGNIDGNDPLDIVAVARDGSSGGGHLFQFTGATHLQWESADAIFTVSTTFDLDGDGRAEVFAGTEDGRVIVLDGITHAEITSMAVGAGEVDAIQVFGGLGSSLAATVVDGRLRVHDISNGSLVAESQTVIGRTRGLGAVADGGHAERLFVGGDTAFRAYRLELDEIFADGFD